MKRFLRWLFRKILGEPHFLVLVGAVVLFGARADAQGCFGPGCGGSSSGGGVTPATLNDATYCPDVGASDAYVCSMVSAPSSYAAGMLVTLSANTANTGTASVNVNSLGVKTIVRSDGTTLQTGDITAGMAILLKYDGTNFRAEFRGGSIISPTGGVTIRSDTYASGSDVGLTVQGSLTGNIQEWKNAANTRLSYITADGTLRLPVGTFGGNRAIEFGSSNYSMYQISTGIYMVTGTQYTFFDGGVGIPLGSTIGFASTTDGSVKDTYLRRYSAGVFAAGASATDIRGLIGGGAAVASATALPLPTGSVFHVTGTTNITSITATNLANGLIIALIFDDVLTFTDGNNLKLNGNFVTATGATIYLAYDGTNFYELGRSTN